MAARQPKRPPRKPTSSERRSREAAEDAASPESETRWIRPVVAIVGRPNVGKSTLFNRIVGKSRAIVHDQPGVTRDRHYAETELRGRPILLVDTGGLDPESEDPFTRGIRRQIEAAIAEADVVVCLLDATQPLSPADHAELSLLRRSKKPVVYLANKADSPTLEAESFDLYRLGIGTLHPVSALHGRALPKAIAAIADELPPQELAPESPHAGEALKLAIIGKPNAGKSSLVNRLLGEERMLVSETAGTTRDAVDTVLSRGDKQYVLIDTAGLRKKARVGKTADAVEGASVLQALRALERCQVAIVVADATEGITDQDLKLIGLVMDRGRGLIVALNKSDLLTASHHSRVIADAKHELSFATWAPIEPISAKTGRGTSRLLQQADRIGAGFNRRIPTGELNRFFESVLLTHPPPTHKGRAPRIFYMTQAEASPPLFVFMASNAEAIPDSYRRYVTNQLREKFHFEGVPIRAKYNSRRRR